MKTWPFHVSCPKWSRLVPQFSLHRIKGSWGCAILSSWSLDGTETRRKMKLNWKDGKAPKTRLPGRSGLLERRQTSWFFVKELYENNVQKGSPEKGYLPLDANMQCRKKKDLFYNAHISEHLWISLYLRGNWENPTKIGWMRKKILKPHPGAFFLLMRKWSIWVEGRSSHILSVIAKGNSRFPAVLLTTFSFEQLFFKKKLPIWWTSLLVSSPLLSPPKEILVAGKLPDKIFIAPHASASAPTWSKEKHCVC